MRATALRLWLPISVSVVLHVLALLYLHDMLMHGKAGQFEAGSDSGLKVRLIDVRSPTEASPQADNTATPLSSVQLPGQSPDQAMLLSDQQSLQPTSQQKPLTAAAPAHPQTLADGASASSITASANAAGVVVKPHAADGGRGNFDSSYIPSTSAERAPIPLTQPNLDALAGMARPHAPIHLRAYVEQSGLVHQVIIVSCQPEDQATAEVLARIYQQVVYMAAYDHGKQVPSKIDFTISLSDSSQPGDRPESNIIRKY